MHNYLNTFHILAYYNISDWIIFYSIHRSIAQILLPRKFGNQSRTVECVQSILLTRNHQQQILTQHLN